jgi:hypothetical protein
MYDVFARARLYGGVERVREKVREREREKESTEDNCGADGADEVKMMSNVYVCMNVCMYVCMYV